VRIRFLGEEGRVMFALTGVIVLVLGYGLAVRPWFLRWGATDAELARAMLGDVGGARPTYVTTLAVTIEAGPKQIWPWLVQMGFQRGGLYSYDWLDRVFGFLDRPSATVVLPEFQRLAVGDEIPVGRGPGFPVRAIVPCQALVLGGESDGTAWVWQFGLYPLDHERTRLVSRTTGRMPPTVGAWLFMRILEPAAFIMTRRMLIGLKSRAEALARSPEATAVRADRPPGSR
jgi:hypothetical protein